MENKLIYMTLLKQFVTNVKSNIYEDKCKNGNIDEKTDVKIDRNETVTHVYRETD